MPDTPQLSTLALLVALAQTARAQDRPGDVMPDRSWDLEHLDLDVRIDPRARTVAGTATWSAQRLDPRTPWLELHQVALQIDAITVDGEPTDGWIAGTDRLRIPVPVDRQQVQVAITYQARPQTGLHFRGGPGAPPTEILEAFSQGEGEDNRYWYPGWDFPNDRFTVRTHLTAPSGLVALANGVLEETNDVDGDWTRWTYHLDHPIVNYLVAVTVGDHEQVEAPGPVPLTYVVPRGTDREVIERTFARTGPQVAFLETLLDEPFPYPLYRQVAVQRFLYGGMENATLTILNDDRLLATAHEPQDRTDTTIAHEIAHQWFGDLLTCYGWRELWLNEGFATYYAGRWQAHDQGPERWGALVRGWHASALRSSGAPMAARAHTRVGDRDNAAVYVKGASVLHMLRVHLGAEVFDRAIAAYLDRHRGQLVETEDLRRVLEDSSGKHLGWLFDQWVTGTGNAALTTRHRFDGSRLEITIDQATDRPAFVAPVEVEIGTPGAEPVLHHLWLDAGTTRLVIPTDQAPAYVAINPRGGLLAEWSHDQAPGAWAAQARHSAHPYARLVAIAALGRAEADDGALRALIALLDEPAPTIRAAAAAALGQTRQAGASEALFAALSDPSGAVRGAAARALGVLGDPEQLRALQGLARSDPDPHVCGEALRALAQLEPDAGRAQARTWLLRPDPSSRGERHRAASDVLSEHGRSSDLASLLPRIEEARTPERQLWAAAEAAVAIASELQPDDPARARLASRLEPLLDSPSVRLRSAGIGWLGRVGASRSEAVLIRFARANQVAWRDLSARALDAAAVIRAGAAQPPPEVPDPDLERLRQEVEALSERLEALERFR